ncbi:MAG TPA: type IV pilus assembly protein PilM [Polyangiaceae bacterium]|jgi:type IV pilus assembly protein PilM|nr:type IV pilus assembly protein PilM [Polyangiaceae bacterium]
MGEGKNLIGVDIGSSSIKVCQIKESRKGLLLHRLGFAPLPPGAVVDGQVMDASTVVETLKRVLADSRVRGREAALSVSGQSVIIRKITVPLMTPSELAEQITWEAEQHIPFDIKDVQVDYQVLRRRADAGQMDLLLVAARKDQISAYAQLAKDAKLKPLVVDIDAFTIQNAFEATFGVEEREVVALINVGASLSSLNVLAGGTSSFTREIAHGGNLITQEIQRQMGVPFEVAEAFKCGAAPDGSPVPAQVAPIIEQSVDSIAAEIQRSLDFFMATSGEGDIARAVLTGGTANLPGLATAIERRARVSVQTLHPATRCTPDSSINRAVFDQRAPQLAVALGLTLRKEREARA